ncbi:MAG: hypothetical protein Q4G08_04700 [Capnocytophaga sp.]|nr:hypothetical protein [Capnocytophaga sp.]
MQNSTDLQNGPVVPSSNVPDNNSKKGGAGSKALIALLAIATAGLGVFAFSLYNEKKKNTEELTRQKDQMITELNALKSDYDKAVDDNTAVNNELVDARNRIDLYIDSLKNMKANVSSLWKYRNQVQVLTKERERLLAINDSLMNSNRYLTRERDSISSALTEISSYKDSLVQQNTKLQKVVETGSALQLTKLEIEAVKERNNGKLVNTTRAKATDKIRVCFTVAANSLAQAGNKYFYVQLISPNGVTLGENNTTSSESTTINYSAVSNFIFENKSVDVCEFVNKGGSDFEKGTYKVRMYNDKLNFVGESDFVLK